MSSVCVTNNFPFSPSLQLLIVFILNTTIRCLIIEKGLSTFIAFMRFFFPCMNSLVSVDLGLLAKSFPHVIFSCFFFSSVSFLKYYKGWCMVETFPTHFIFIQLVTCLSSLVADELCLPGKVISTIIPSIVFPPSATVWWVAILP